MIEKNYRVLWFNVFTSMSQYFFSRVAAFDAPTDWLWWRKKGEALKPYILRKVITNYLEKIALKLSNTYLFLSSLVLLSSVLSVLPFLQLFMVSIDFQLFFSPSVLFSKSSLSWISIFPFLLFHQFQSFRVALPASLFPPTQTRHPCFWRHPATSYGVGRKAFLVRVKIITESRPRIPKHIQTFV